VKKFKNLSSEHDRRMDQMRDHNRQLLNERDVDNNQKIEEVRDYLSGINT